jgi:hypothetical protein
MQGRIEAGIYPLSAGFLPGLPSSFLVAYRLFADSSRAARIRGG